MSLGSPFPSSSFSHTSYNNYDNYGQYDTYDHDKLEVPEYTNVESFDLRLVFDKDLGELIRGGNHNIHPYQSYPHNQSDIIDINRMFAQTNFFDDSDGTEEIQRDRSVSGEDDDSEDYSALEHDYKLLLEDQIEAPGDERFNDFDLENDDDAELNGLLDDCNVFVKYLPPDLTEHEFYKMFKSFGTIVSSKIMVDQGTGKSLGYGFVRYSNSAASQKAINQMNGHRIANKRLLCKLANLSTSSFNSEFSKHPILNSQTPNDNIYIKPLLKDTSEEDLRKLFGKFGNIIDCKVMIDRNTGLSRQIGFVRFETQSQATAAINEMNNYKLYPSAHPLTVKFADTKEQKNARKALRQKQTKVPERYTPVLASQPSPPPYPINSNFGESPLPYGETLFPNYLSPSSLPAYEIFSNSPIWYHEGGDIYQYPVSSIIHNNNINIQDNDFFVAQNVTKMVR